MGIRKRHNKRWDSVDNFLTQEKEIRAQSKVFSHLSASTLAIIFVILLSQFELDGLKGILVDALYRSQWWTSAQSDLVLIAYDDDSSRRYGTNLRIPAEEFAQVFAVLKEEKPKAVGIIGNINPKVYTDGELAQIAQSFSSVPNTFVGYTDDDSLGKPISPLVSSVPFLPGFISRDSFSYGADSVTRRVMLRIDGFQTLYSELASLYRNDKSHRFSHQHPYGKGGHALQTYIAWQGPEGTYPLHPSRDVVERKYPKGTFTNKIVLFGSAMEAKKGADHIFTPYSREPFKTTLLEGAAHSLVSLMRDNGLFRPSRGATLLFCLLIGVLTVNIVLFLSPGKGILFVIGLLATTIASSWVALFGFHCWLDLAHPLLVGCVGYYLVIPYRLVDEYRKRWHYQEKSELMTQLEQLKSNFLSLISHDLKTPIARIQGNAELVLSEAHSGLNEKQRKCLSAIVHTTEDLSEYVETVLDLTRIESAKIPLQKTSKDINSTILEVIENKRFLALEKNILLSTDLEPLFSIKFDVKLIRRVLSNLLENAIKYSPGQSRITLSSREEGNWIKVSVSDEGVGISREDREKVFTKFYRCDNSEMKDVKGTGLGLYLVKYFVELHRGFVELQSELGKGSTFTVALPV